MRTPVVLGLDLGTSSVKVAAVDATGNPVASGSASYPAAGSRGFAPSQAADRTWWPAVSRATAQVLSAAPVDVLAIGLSGQMHGVVAVDARGHSAYEPVLWNDARAAPIMPQIMELAAPFRADLVNELSAGRAASILYWLSRTEPAVLAQTRWALQPKDWLGYRLTGDIATDPSDASGTGLWDFRRASWHRQFCDVLQVNSGLLAPVLPADQVRGALRAAAARDLGLAPGIPVAVGRADTAASLLGSGSPLAPGQTVLTMGTGAQLCQIVAGPGPGAGAGAAGAAGGGAAGGGVLTTAGAGAGPGADVMTVAGPAADGHFVMAATHAAGLTLDWARQLWSLSWEQFFRIAFSAQRGAGAPVMIPFTPPRQPGATDAEPRALWSGLQLGHGRPDLLRAAIDGVVYALRLAQERLLGHPAVAPFAACTVVGGLAGHEQVRQLVADVLRVTVRSPDVVSSSARGAAVSASITAGWFGTAPEAAAHFARPFSELVPDRDAAGYHAERFRRFAALATAQPGPGRD